MNSQGFWKPPGYGESREFRGKSHSREIGKFLGNVSKIGKFLGNRQISGKNRQISGKSANFWKCLKVPFIFNSRERPSRIREMISRERRSGIRDKSLRDTTLGIFEVDQIPLATHHEPSALYCWILEILYCDPKGRRALLRVPSKVGRSACLCWAHS